MAAKWQDVVNELRAQHKNGGPKPAASPPQFYDILGGRAYVAVKLCF